MLLDANSELGMTGENSQPTVTLIDSSDDTRWDVQLTPAGLSVGRLPTNDVVLEDGTVSRRHLRLDWDGKIASVTDLGSTRGTSLGGQMLEAHKATPWNPDQDLIVGRYLLQLRLPRARSASRPRDAVRVFAHPAELSIAPGTPATVQLTIANFDHRVDHLNIRVDGIPESWLRLPTRSVRLRPGAHETIAFDVLVRPEERPRAGAYDVTVHVWSDAIDENRASLPLRWTVETIPEPVEPEMPKIRTPDRSALSVNPQAFTVTPGVPATVAVFVENRNPESDEFELAVTGVPRAWLTSPAAPLPVDAESAATAMLQINAPRSAESVARSYTLNVASRSLRTGQVSTATAQCTVAPFTDIALRIEPRLRSGRFKGAYQVRLQNRGNARAQVALAGSTADGRLSFQFSPPGVTLEPSATAAVALAVRARDRWSSQEVAYPFQVHARAGSQELGQASAEYRQRPAVLAWTLSRVWAGVSLVAGVLIRLVIVLAFLLLLAVAVALIVGEIWDIDVQQEVSDFLTSSVWSREEPAPGSAQAVIWQLEA